MTTRSKRTPQKQRSSRSRTTHRKRQRQTTTQSYRNVLVGFGIVALVIALVIVFLTLPTATIVIRAVPGTVETDVVVRVVAEDPADNETTTEPLVGAIFTASQTITREVASTGSERTVEARAEGTVRVVNTYSADQPLVENTRLLSPDGVQVRTTESVVVPAGGEVTVGVIADDPGQRGELPPTRFSIPGLWSGFVDVIYAENDEQLSGGVVTVRSVSQEEIDAALESLIADADEQLDVVIANDERLPENPRVITANEETRDRRSSAAEGDTAASFTVSITRERTVVAVSRTDLESQARAAIVPFLKADQQIVGNLVDTAVFEVRELSREDGTASIAATIRAVTTANDAERVFSVSAYVNKDRASIQRAFANQEEYDLVDVRFSPFWAVRTPAFPNRITIKVVE